MAFERIGLGVDLTMDVGKFVSGMKRGRDEMGRFTKSTNLAGTALVKLKTVGAGAVRSLGRSLSKVRSGMGAIATGLSQATIAFAPLGLAAGAGAKSFVDFEQQMMNVRSVAKDMTQQEFAQTIARAKELGATTQFTATQAGEGFENLARAGFSFQQRMDAIGGTLNLAAADSIDLATATDITASVLRGMNLEMDQANRVADVLAQTSANSNTNVIQLGEAFKFAAPVAKDFGLTLEDTAIALGLTANAGLRGTLAGTSVKNMMLKLAKPTSKATGFMKQYGIQVLENADGSLNLRKTLDSVIEGTKGITSSTQRAAVISEVFGLRGQGAVSAISSAIEKGDFDKLAGALDNAKGAAEAMAKIRLDSFKGQLTLLQSAAEGLAIEVFGPFVSFAKDGLENSVIPFVQDVVKVLQELAKPAANVDELGEKFGVAAQVALGIADAMAMIRRGINVVIEKGRQLGAWMESTFGEDITRQLTKWGVVLAAVATAAVPIGLAFVAAGFAVSGLITAISGVASVISGAFLPILIIGGLVVGVFAAVRRENETFMQTAQRVWSNVKAWVIDVWQNVLKPMWAGIKEAATIVLPQLEAVWKDSMGIIKAALIDLFRAFGIEMDGNKTDWKEIGKIAVFVLGAIIEAVIKVGTHLVVMIVTAIKLIKAWAIAIADSVILPFNMVWSVVREIGGSLAMIFGGDMIAGFKRLGTALLNFVLEPLRFILRQAIRIADAVSVDIPDSVRNFANQGFVLQELQTEAPKVSFGERGSPGFLDSPLEQVKAVDEASEAAQTMKNLEDAFSGGLNDLLGEGGPIAKKLDEQTEQAKKAPCVDSTVAVNLDGSEVARSTQRHQAELKDRAGFRSSPYQRRIAAEHGAVPV